MGTAVRLLRIGVLVLAGQAAVARACLAQNRVTLYRGQQVRLTALAVGVQKQKALFVGTRGDTLILTTDRELTLAISDVARLEVLRGRRSHKWLGAGVGATLGVATGVAIGLASGDSESLFFEVPAETKALLAGAAFGLAGGLVGAMVGNAIKTDRWSEVPLDRLRVSIAQQGRGRLGLGMSVTF